MAIENLNVFSEHWRGGLSIDAKRSSNGCSGHSSEIKERKAEGRVNAEGPSLLDRSTAPLTSHLALSRYLLSHPVPQWLCERPYVLIF